MRSIVMKFGGSSLADAACLRQASSLITAALPQAPLVVLSAMGETTDQLFAAARMARTGEHDNAIFATASIIATHRVAAGDLFSSQIPASLNANLEKHQNELETLLRGVALLRELTPRSMDAIASFGERLSTELLAAFLVAQGIAATLMDARTILRTDSTFGAAQPNREVIKTLGEKHLTPFLEPNRVVVTQGYIGATDDGLTTTLGRGGSDTTAALLGAAIAACEVQIWTDVEGILTCDPRIVPGAQPISEVSFAEAAELAAFGAKVLHPASIQPAVAAGIPITVRHTLLPHGHFTTIREHANLDRAVTAIASRGGITILTLTSSRMLNQSGFLARLFEVFARHRVSVDLVATAETSVSLTVDNGIDLQPILTELSAFATVNVATNRSIVAVVGEKLRPTPGLGARIFTALEEVNVELISMGGSETNLSVVVRESAEKEAVRLLHTALFERRG